MVKDATSLKLEKELMAMVKAGAIKQNRSIINFIETVLLEYFEKEEIEKQKETPTG